MAIPVTEILNLQKKRNSVYIRENGNTICHTPPQQNKEREFKWLDILEPYYKEFNLNSDDIKKDADRKPFDEEKLKILAEFKSPIVSFHFGLPSPSLVSRVK